MTASRRESAMILAGDHQIVTGLTDALFPLRLRVLTPVTAATRVELDFDELLARIRKERPHFLLLDFRFGLGSEPGAMDPARVRLRDLRGALSDSGHSPPALGLLAHLN